MIKILVILAGVFLCQQSAYYQGLYTGYNIAAVRFGGECYPQIGGLCYSHGDPYSALTNLHVYVNWLLIIFILGNLMKKELISHLIAIPSILLTLSFFIYVYFFKVSFLSDDIAYLNLIRETLFPDLIRIGLASASLLLQLYLAFADYRNLNRTKLEV